MRRTKIFFALVLVILVFLSVPYPAFASNEAINDARNSVVRVVAEHSDGSVGYGSAFIIAHSGTSSFLVSNLHVVGYMPLKVWIISNDISGNWIEAQITYLQVTDGLDLVILTTTAGLSGRPVLPLAGESAEDRNISATDEVYALGFPAVADLILTEGHMLPSSADDVSVTRGIVSRVNLLIDETEAFQSDALIHGGNSGGPMLNSYGVVIGVNTWGLDNISYSIHISYIIEACDQLNIPVNIVSTAAVILPDSSPALLIVAVTAAAVAVVACGLYFFKFRKPSGAPAYHGQTGDHASAAYHGQAGGPASAGYMPQSAAVPHAYDQVPAQQSASHKLTGIIGTGGQYNTMSFPVPVKAAIGRDPAKCGIVFAPQTKGVSSLHCEIVRMGDGLQIYDRGSSYGTFLGGTKLPVNMPYDLTPGDSFYLGEERNSFTVY